MNLTLSKSKTHDLTIPDECRGLRLDQALARLLPDMGRRGTRRLLGGCEVLVDGAARVAGFRVSGGERVRISCPDMACGKAAPVEGRFPVIEVAGRNADFAALVKPAGMHCEALSGRSSAASSQNMAGAAGVSFGHTAQEALAVLFPEASAVLLNRLDLPVSGLVLAALHQDAAVSYAAWQDQGAVRKHYLAVVSGKVAEEMEIRLALDTARRRKVRVLSREEPDALRWTQVFPASYRETSNETLVRVEIRKGRRHQIRAHLAAAGHPVKSDPLYGTGPDQGWIRLHHCRVAMPGFAACDVPDWAERVWPARSLLARLVES